VADDQVDPGGNTEMFRAFVAGSEAYEARAASRGPIIVAAVAVLLALLAFVVIVARG